MCTGDTLKCLQLKFTWKIQCHTQGNEITNGVGCAAGDVPVCVGKSCKAEAYSQLLQQWRQRCAAEAEREKAGNDAASGAADAASDDEAGVVAGLWGEGTTPELTQDKVSIGGGDVLPVVTIYGHTWTAPAEFYSALAVIRRIVIACFMLWGFWILWRR
jgi:hypothetical protein